MIIMGLPKLIQVTLQTHHVDSTLTRRGNDRFHVVSTWNPLGVFVGNLLRITDTKVLPISDIVE